MKACTKCGSTKPKTEFSKRAGSSDGLRNHCKTCVYEYRARYLVENHDNERTRKAQWYKSNRETALAASAKWNAANKEMVRAYQAEWYEANKEKVRAAYSRWMAANPEAKRICNQNRRARKRAAGGKLSSGLAEKLFRLQHGKCACCKQPLGEDYHLDHIMPLALGGTNTDDNMQLLSSKCNLQKNARHPVDFMQQRGFLL